MKRRIFFPPSVTVALWGLLAAATAPAFFLSRWLFYAELGVLLIALLVILIRLRMSHRDMRRALSRAAGALNHAEQQALTAFPLPALLCAAGGDILWYNAPFRDSVSPGASLYGENAAPLLGGVTLTELANRRRMEITCRDKRYTVCLSALSGRGGRGDTVYLLYFLDITRERQLEREYALSRPAVLVVYIDNVEEITQQLRDSERARMVGRVETLLEDTVSETGGILRKYQADWFQLVLEQRDLQGMLDARFPILDRVRALTDADGRALGLTLSIGVGRGASLKESEQLARQAIDMALGRGGDQAAVRTGNGYDFYGGRSQGVEKRGKVRTRIVASALRELIEGSDQVLTMGHRYSDLDCLGAAASLASLARSLGKPAWAAAARARTMAETLLAQYDAAAQAAGTPPLFIEPEAALARLTDRTLLIVADTHNPAMLEHEPLYRAAKTVAVIDHHRKQVEHIGDAVLFYHEAGASSASEMTAELLPYLGGRVTPLDAQALLAGIMLDTRGFVLKAGARTFEAAAYLRRLGADTVAAKQLFAGSVQVYRRKSALVASARFYKDVAVAWDAAPDGDTRIAAAQAADELLGIQGVRAAFALFMEEGVINISARSFGAYNVQLIMERLGGGGHHTMAGAQLRGVTPEEAERRLIEAVNGVGS